MEVVVDDSLEIAARRAHKAFKRIGKIDEYDAASHLEGRIYSNGYPARVKVRWGAHRDTVRVRLDITATSHDGLSRAADTAMYRFARTYKEVDPLTLDEADRVGPSARFVFLFVLCVLGVLILGGVIWGRQSGFFPLDTVRR